MREPEGRGQAGEYTHYREPGALAEDEAHYVVVLRSESDANSDFARAVCDGIGDESVQANHGKNQGERREAANQIGRVAAKKHRRRLGDDLVHGERLDQSQLRIQSMQ